MRDLFYVELKKRIGEVRAKGIMKSPGVLTAEAEHLLKMAESLDGLYVTTRKEGLIIVGELADEMEESPSVLYLRKLAGTILNYADSKISEDIGFQLYLTSNYSDYIALEYLLVLYIVIELFESEPFIVVKEKLYSLLPGEIREEIERRELEKERIEEEKRDAERAAEKAIDISASLIVIEEEPSADLMGADTDFVRNVEHEIYSCSDMAVQRILRELNETDLSLAMKVFGSDLKEVLFKNMSRRTVADVAEKYLAATNPDRELVMRAVNKMYDAFKKLCDDGVLTMLES